MTIEVNGVNVSIPTHISEWIKESDDNRTEFYGMLDSFIFAVKSFYKDKCKPNPYEKIYEKQLEDVMLLSGQSREEAEKYLSDLITKSFEESEKEFEKNGMNRILEILKQIHNS